ncbi:hypothetical protein GGR53DRAFT_484499 [Hypoxylon sp. FL1150]|nr:hypothetical protein GGR53DRAFT_484499 [Hypoxylon sp. FL1150]
MAYFRGDARERPKQFILFLDEKLIDTLPVCSAAAFKRPQFRKCSFDLTAIDLKHSRSLSGRLDGFIWKIRL